MGDSGTVGGRHTSINTHNAHSGIRTAHSTAHSNRFSSSRSSKGPATVRVHANFEYLAFCILHIDRRIYRGVCGAQCARSHINLLYLIS